MRLSTVALLAIGSLAPDTEAPLLPQCTGSRELRVHGERKLALLLWQKDVKQPPPGGDGDEDLAAHAERAKL